MPRKRTPTLTEAELRFMEILWAEGEATVTQVIAAMPTRNRPAYNTVLTTLRILEQKGYLAHSKQGRAFIYRPLVSCEQAQRQAMQHVKRSFFGNSPSLLLRSILADEELSAQELEELKLMIDSPESGPETS